MTLRVLLNVRPNIQPNVRQYVREKFARSFGDPVPSLSTNYLTNQPTVVHYATLGGWLG